MNDLTSWKLFYELARISKAVYAGPIRHNIYTYNDIPFKEQKIIHGSFGRGYCRLFWNDHQLVIAFRGTRESVDWSVSNFKAFPVKLRDCSDADNVRVHRGFQRTLDYGDKTTELRSLDAINKHIENLKLLNKKITITGHSMGGALAILYAVKFRSKWPDICEKNLSEIVTFGSPSVGLSSFKHYFNDLENKTFRLINKSDGVPFTPPFFYRHVGKEIWLKSNCTIMEIGWPKRLLYALKTPFSMKDDHSILEYIDRIKEEIAKN